MAKHKETFIAGEKIDQAVRIITIVQRIREIECQMTRNELKVVCHRLS
jgi:hypothetical protein